MAAAACYPNGPTAPSVTGQVNDIFVAQGWPKMQALDQQIDKGMTNVSIVSIGGGTANCFQILDESHVIVPAIHGMSATLTLSASAGTVTIAGAPGPGEYLTIIADGKHAYSRVGYTLADVLAALLSDASTDYGGVTTTSNSITLPTTRIAAHIGSPATMGKVTHRQKEMMNVTVWAPSPQARNAVAAAIDVALKATNRLIMPDTSQAILTFSHTHQTDGDETKSIYRRDLVFAVEYATLETFQAFEVTSFNPTYDGGTPGANPFTNAAG